MEIKPIFSLVALTENIISRIIKNFLYRKKKLHAVYSLKCNYTDEILKKITSNYNNVKIINLDEDFKFMLTNEEVARCDELKITNVQQFKLIYYPIILKYVNIIFKYYARKNHIILICDNNELIKFCFGDKRILTLLPNEELFNKLDNKNELNIKRVEIYKSFKNYYEYQDINSAVEKIKESFKI